MIPSLVGVSFAFAWDGSSLADYFENLRATMPQEAPGGLGDGAYADLVAYLLARNDYPSGDAELLPDPDRLRRIVIRGGFR